MPEMMRRDLPTALTPLETGRLPSIPADFQVKRIGKGRIVPDRVVYTSGGGLMPALPADPDLPKALTVTTRNKVKNGKLPNGLTRRADIMARLHARGASIVAAYRAAYGYSGDPVAAARHSQRIASTGKYRPEVERYRKLLEAEARQQQVGLQDFVKSRLVHEAQSARNDGARIRALELLGKTEGMFVDVKRSEKVIDQRSLEKAKAELNQRLKQTLMRLAPALAMQAGVIPHGPSHDQGTDTAGSVSETADRDPHRGHTPLIASGSHPGSEDSNPLSQSHISDTPSVSFSDHPPARSLMDTTGTIGPVIHMTTPIGSPQEPSPPGRYVTFGDQHREMSLDDL